MDDDDFDNPTDPEHPDKEQAAGESPSVFSPGALEAFLQKHGVSEEEDEAESGAPIVDESGSISDLLGELMESDADEDSESRSTDSDLPLSPDDAPEDIAQGTPPADDVASGSDATDAPLEAEEIPSAEIPDQDIAESTAFSNSADEVLDGGDMDAPLVVEGDTDTIDDDADYAEEPNEAELPTEPESAAPEQPEGLSPADDDTAGEQADEDVVLENIAAGAEQNDASGVQLPEPQSKELEDATADADTDSDPAAADEEEDAADPVSDEQEPADQEGDTEAEPKRRYVRPPMAAALAAPIIGLGILFRRNPARFATTCGAALFAFGLTYTFMHSHSFRSASPEDFLTRYSEADVRVAIEQATALMEEGEGDNALDLLDEVLASAAPSPAVIDARYLRLEALVNDLPDEPHPSVANAMHAEIDHLVNDARDHPRAAEALLWKGKLYEREDNVPAARHTYREVMKDFGRADSLDDVLIAFAELELRTDRPREAAAALQRLLDTMPSSDSAPRAHLLLADTYAAVGNVEDARSIYVRTIEEGPETPTGAQAFERLGKLALESGRPDLAISELEARLNNATTVQGNDMVHLRLAQAYRAAGRLEDAERTLQEIIDFFPPSEITPDVHVELSEVLREMGEPRRALREALDAYDIYPDRPVIARNLGDTYLMAGDGESAADAYVRAHNAGADDPPLLTKAAELYRKAESLTRTRRVYEELIRAFPGTPEAFNAELSWAEVVSDQGHPALAIERLEEIMLTADTSESGFALRALSTMAPIYQELGLPEKAVSAYKRIAEIADDNALRANAAQFLLDSESPDDGLAYASKVDVSKLEPSLAYDFLQSYGRILLRADDERALALLEQAHASYPLERRPEAVQLLLEANLTLGKTARARTLVLGLAADAGKSGAAAYENPQVVRAANTWGDYLYGRGDYGAASGAYAVSLPERAPAGDADPAEFTDRQLWAAHQHATAQMHLGEIESAQPWFGFVAKSKAPWAAEAANRRDEIALRNRLRPTELPAG